jgi:hypothetical protein
MGPEIAQAGFPVLALSTIGMGCALWLRRRYLGLPALFLLVSTIVVCMVGFSSALFHGRAEGRFPNAEFELTFHDPNGKPLPGVELQVENRLGNVANDYPVTDFKRSQPPHTNENGVMVFHHVGHGLEFGADRWELFFVIQMGDELPPQFLCRFLLDGREVYRINYHELYGLSPSGPGTPKVTRRWKLPEAMQQPGKEERD